ncbi:MAG: PRC-barrel domain-containing protein, partial [Pseudomonadales bacterium]
QDDYDSHQLTGIEVINEADECLGVIDQMLETGANDVIVVSPTKDSIDDQERLIPWVEPEFIRQVDLANEKVLVTWSAEY